MLLIAIVLVLKLVTVVFFTMQIFLVETEKLRVN